MNFRDNLAAWGIGPFTFLFTGIFLGGCSPNPETSMRETSMGETSSATRERGVSFEEIRLPEPVHYESPEHASRGNGLVHGGEVQPSEAPAVQAAPGTTAGIQPPDIGVAKNPKPWSVPSSPFKARLPETDNGAGISISRKRVTGNRVAAQGQGQSYSATPTQVPANPSPSSIVPSAAAPAVVGPTETPSSASDHVVTSDHEQVADESAYQTVSVFYATDRKEAELSLADFHLTGQRRWISALGFGGGMAAIFFFVACVLRRRAPALLTGGLMVAMSIAAMAIFVSGNAGVEKMGVAYTAERGELVRGVCEVTIPKNHSRGELERPSLLKFEVNEDQSKHIVLTSVEPLPSDQFHQELQSELAASQEPDLLVFIHGYNVDFESAVQRTAQISVDLPFQGVPVCYSWPSQGTLLGYPVDENNVTWTVGHLKQFLGELVLQSGAKSIHVVAHSMGNRAMTSAMQQLALTRQQDGPLFDRVVLAAPDVDADLFRKDLAPALTKVAKHVTLYASSSDQALIASKQVHGYPRAGETGEHLVVVNGVDTIDVSGIDLSLLGHSYYGESEPMLRDLFKVLLSRLPASQRDTLISRDFQSKIYWQLANQSRIASGVSR